MQQPLSPEVLQRELEWLSQDLVRLLPELNAQVRDCPWWDVENVFLVGSGDSLCAGMSAEMAFEEFARVRCRAISPLEFTAYTFFDGPRSLVIVVSASGYTPETVQALAHARNHGARTLAITTNREAALCEGADRSVITYLPDKEPSPGLRSYQATMLAAFMVALDIGANRGYQVEHVLAEVATLARAVEATAVAVNQPVRELVKHSAITGVWVVAGSGPNRGTAHYCAAKFVEALGHPAMAPDINEWWHVERNLLPRDSPVFIIAPPGRAQERALQVGRDAARLGRRVYMVADIEHVAFGTGADLVFPVHGTPSEILSPFLYYLFAPAVAGSIAQATGTKLFPARA